MFGRFLELGIATQDIATSVQFYERLGFSQLITGDAWSHRYGVLGDGRVHLGLHERAMPSPAHGSSQRNGWPAGVCNCDASASIKDGGVGKYPI